MSILINLDYYNNSIIIIKSRDLLSLNLYINLLKVLDVVANSKLLRSI